MTMVLNGRTTEGRARPAELLERITPDTYRMAYDAGMNLSLWLERECPSGEYDDGLDAFERLLKVAGLITRSRPEIGLWACELGDFEQREQTRNLIPELIARFWRSASFGKSASTRAVYTSEDELPGTSMRPYASDLSGRWASRAQVPIALADITAITTPIRGNAYQAYYLTASTDEIRLKRVAEGTEIPTAKITGGDHTIKLKKHGRGVEQTYETMRRMRIDKIRLWMERLARQNEADKVSEAISTLVSGDGNTGTAATNWRAKTDLDAAATSKTITLKAYLAFKLKFAPAYTLTHIIGVEGDILKLALVNIGSSGASVPTYLADVTGAMTTQQRLRDGVTWGMTADVPTDKLVGIDASAALEHVIEIGSEITEMERWARRQTESIFMTIVEGFAVFDPSANKTLELES